MRSTLWWKRRSFSKLPGQVGDEIHHTIDSVSWSWAYVLPLLLHTHIYHHSHPNAFTEGVSFCPFTIRLSDVTTHKETQCAENDTASEPHCKPPGASVNALPERQDFTTQPRESHSPISRHEIDEGHHSNPTPVLCNSNLNTRSSFDGSNQVHGSTFDFSQEYLTIINSDSSQLQVSSQSSGPLSSNNKLSQAMAFEPENVHGPVEVFRNVSGTYFSGLPSYISPPSTDILTFPNSHMPLSNVYPGYPQAHDHGTCEKTSRSSLGESLDLQPSQHTGTTPPTNVPLDYHRLLPNSLRFLESKPYHDPRPSMMPDQAEFFVEPLNHPTRRSTTSKPVHAHFTLEPNLTSSRNMYPHSHLLAPLPYPPQSSKSEGYLASPHAQSRRPQSTIESHHPTSPWFSKPSEDPSSSRSPYPPQHYYNLHHETAGISRRISSPSSLDQVPLLEHLNHQPHLEYLHSNPVAFTIGNRNDVEGDDVSKLNWYTLG